MKKVIYLSFVASVLLLNSCGESAKFQALQNSKDSLQYVLNQKDKEANEYLTLINQIDENFEKIKAAEGQITVVQEGANPTLHEKAQANIDYITKLIADNKAKIAELQKYKNSVGALQSSVNKYKKQLEEKEALIAELQAQLAERDAKIKQQDSTIIALNYDLGNLTAAKQQVDNVAISQDAELNAAYYLFGTLKDLKNKGVNIKKSDLRKNGFTQIDIRDVTSLDLGGKKGTVLSLHPKGSYKINVVDKKATLEIIDPAEFWSITRYLVVKVKK
ncbi:MAG: hypothetical protein LBN27_14030 [Prevotellaceae bacterium]|jgi:chromosome segregation ATPase|nr:hypothetical protein [Prevotellaceae bacterium]